MGVTFDELNLVCVGFVGVLPDELTVFEKVQGDFKARREVTGVLRAPHDGVITMEAVETDCGRMASFVDFVLLYLSSGISGEGGEFTFSASLSELYMSTSASLSSPLYPECPLLYRRDRYRTPEHPLPC